jgi:hypothetical protein
MKSLGGNETDRDPIDADAALYVLADVAIRIRTFLQ